MNCQELIHIIKGHKGKVEMPVLAKDDVNHIIVEKGDLLRVLRRDRQAEAPWEVTVVYDGVMRLDIV